MSYTDYMIPILPKLGSKSEKFLSRYTNIMF